MKDVYIINAGGFGRNMASTARGDIAHGKDWLVKGFLDGRQGLMQVQDLPIVGDPMTFRSEPSQLFICALGNPLERRRFAQPLLEQGAQFMNLLPKVHRSERSQMGMGCLFEHDVSLGADARLGDFVITLANTIVGYDVIVGSYTTIASFVFIGGGACIGENVTIHPHATILPGVKIGDGAVIGAGSVVIGNVPPGVTMFGNPAKRFSFR
ncbi:acetyltransferase [Delftia acidovorans]|jgi:sugar O-acyltransferase (sialic acid O-acetyltransferase NeuD family)|uniref:PglD-related sugar-binding protein n=1 Tax=Delftia TaxID=80865 RepID=UPI0018E72306|nr:acetyltransferase [Delftia acidovorans]MBJ2144386.1 acetyltransferase [Delftia acidovorans]